MKISKGPKHRYLLWMHGAYPLSYACVTLFGKTGLNKNSVMHLKCVDNGSQRICNVIQSIVKTLTVFKNGSKMFLNALATFSNV